MLTSCRRALERLFVEVRKEWPLTGVAERLRRNDREMNEAVLRAAADELGLTELPHALRRMNRNNVRPVCDYDDNWRLRPLVAATLLRAQIETNHPLRSAARKAPDLLARIEGVTALGAEAVHGGESGALDPDAVDTSVQATIEIAGYLLNLPVRPIKEILRDGEKGEGE